MGTISSLKLKTGKQSFRAEIRREGVRHTKCFRRRTDASLWIKEQESAINRGAFTAPLKRHTLAEAIDRYLSEILPIKKRGTQVLHRSQLQWFRLRIGKIQLWKLTSGDLAAAREILRQQEVKRPFTDRPFLRSTGTVNRYFVPLLNCLRICRDDWGWLQTVPKLSKLDEPRGRTRYFTPSEARSILSCFDLDPRKDVRLVIRIAMTVGSRLGETCALTWQNVDLDERVLVFTTTKSGEVKGVPIPDGLHSELVAWKRDATGEFLFPATRKSRLPYIYDGVRKSFKKALGKLGISNASFHSTRHTVGSWATQDGVNRRKVAEVLGHRDLKTTDRYSHLDVEHLRSVVRDLETRLIGEEVTVTNDKETVH